MNRMSTLSDSTGLRDDWIRANVPDGFTLVAVGDLIATHPMAQLMRRRFPELMSLLDGADVVFGNYEGNAIDFGSFNGYPEALAGGGWLVGSPRVPADLREMGFNLVGRANNHTLDWGVEGMRSTTRLLDAAGIVHAGTGETLAQARAPAFLGTAGGRVALVSFASRFEANARAIDPLGEVPGRPGLNALRTTRYMVVSPERLAELARIRDALPTGAMRASVLRSDAASGTVTLMDSRFKTAPSADERVSFDFTVDERDRAEIIRNMRQAKQSADFAIATMHTHEPGNYSTEAPAFMREIARQAIDNGADAFVGHGPHQLRGIEVYKGKPIFYSLGNFFFMDNTMQPVTRDEFDKDRVDPASMTPAEFMEARRVHGVFKDSQWFESVVAVTRYDTSGQMMEIQLHPIELHHSGSRDADRGIPRLAPPDVGERILARLRRLSAPYGTDMRIEGGIGRIRV